MSQNFPNPFGKTSRSKSSTTKIEYSLPEQSAVRIEVFNALGQSVAVLVNSEKSAGNYKTVWDAKGLPSGLYLISVRAEGFASKSNYSQVKKALLLK
ncbi:MAG: T9SS type A sorting domain-containing protein [Chlorobi bacterium]|nr:T9SS type A sorting domain-containing protein [Chlorobiota bacterium]